MFSRIPSHAATVLQAVVNWPGAEKAGAHLDFWEQHGTATALQGVGPMKRDYRETCLYRFYEFFFCSGTPVFGIVLEDICETWLIACGAETNKKAPPACW